MQQVFERLSSFAFCVSISTALTGDFLLQSVAQSVVQTVEIREDAPRLHPEERLHHACIAFEQAHGQMLRRPYRTYRKFLFDGNGSQTSIASSSRAVSFQGQSYRSTIVSGAARLWHISMGLTIQAESNEPSTSGLHGE
jgi:hypothetical protein